jgi:long-chain acyl-CoA synthetase
MQEKRALQSVEQHEPAQLVRPWLEHYPNGVPQSITYPQVAIGDILDQVVQQHEGAIALIFQGRTLSWQEVHRLAERLAASLYRLGVRKGDRVVFLLPNVPHFVIAYYATLKLGAVVVAANPLFVERELEAQIRDAGGKVIITLDILYEKIGSIWRAIGVEHVLVGSVLDFMPTSVRIAVSTAAVLERWSKWAVTPQSTIAANMTRVMKAAEKRFPLLRRLREVPQPAQPIPYSQRVHRFLSLLRAIPERLPQVDVKPEDLAALLYTGGTTGFPKAAMLTHRNLVANALQMRHWFPDLQEEKETILAILPFFHAYGLTLALNAGLMLAARLILIPRIVLQDIFEAIERFRPTALPAVPAIFIALVNSERTTHYDLRSIRICVSGGAPLPVEIKQQFEALTGGHLYEGYGLTEASPLTHAQPYDQSAPAGSIGLPVPDTDAQIVDEGGNPLPVGAVGELIVRGPQVMAGYWNRPDETAAVLRGGWLYTGDIARMDEQGYFFIVDRKKDVIITGGENIYPREIEEVLYQHPKVKECAVAGVPHEYGGEIAKAFIVLKEGERATKAEITRWLSERLAKYKVPRAIEFRSELPKSATGKILRRELVAEEATQTRKRLARKEQR